MRGGGFTRCQSLFPAVPKYSRILSFFNQGVIMPVVIVKMRKGWSVDQKRTIVQEFTDTLVRTLKVEPDLVTIMIDEHELENIGKAGRLRSDMQ
jgi:4-oxalocrotonate tautomerase